MAESATAKWAFSDGSLAKGMDVIMDNLERIVEDALAGKKRAISKLISGAERGGAEAASIERAIRNKLGRALIIGITGPPGAGKSTLTNSLVRLLRERGKSVGVIAVDPTSPFTGGAILGDRVRMDSDPDDGIFIRSMGTRGAFGGLSTATRSAVNVLDACGFDVVIVETVGIGQIEIGIVNEADIVLVLNVPGLGDDIQAIKAGILEIGDVFVVNKCDLPGADRVSVELKSSLSLSSDERRRETPVLMVSAETGKGMNELLNAVETQFSILQNSGEITLRRGLRLNGGNRAGLILAAGGGGIGMKCLNMDHIGVAVKSLEDSAAFYENILGIKRTGIEEVDEQQVRVMFLPCGDCEVELLESTSEDGPVARFIEKNGEGVQHIAIRVEDIDAALAEMKEKGIRMIDETPRYGAGGARIAFVHPKATKGVLLELCERK